MRPTSKISGEPRFGSVIERLFGTTTMFLSQLLSNTQATKVPRQMMREVDPKRLDARMLLCAMCGMGV